MDEKKWYMAGTEKTGEYTVLAVSGKGRVGVRKLPDGFRVRFEPSGQSNFEIGHLIMSGLNWNMPSQEQPRFSVVVPSEELVVALAAVIKSISDDDDDIEYNENIPDWLEKASQEVVLIGRRDFPLIEALRLLSDLFSSKKVLAVAKVSKPAVAEGCIDLSILCDRLLETMGVQA